MRLAVRPLTPDLWPALEDLFGPRGACGDCWCMYWRIGSAYRARPSRLNKAAFREIVKRGPPPGLLAFDGDVAVGWCQVTPRDALPWLDRTWRLRRVESVSRTHRADAAPCGLRGRCPLRPRVHHARVGSCEELDMIEHRLDTAQSILYVRPKSALAEDDFVQLARTVDPYIERTGDLAGLIIEVAAFPGWDGLGAMAAHFRFVRDHHKRVKKVAVVTDAALGNLAEKLASHFVSATIKHFPAGGSRAAEQWIKGEISL